MARTFGGVSTDSVESRLTAHASFRTYSVWTFRTGNGGGNLGRVFDKRVAGAEVELLFYNQAAGVYQYNRAWSGGAGNFTISAPAANVAVHLALTYDSTSTGAPSVYVNGLSQTVTTSLTPSGTASTNADGYVLGNRKTDNARNWAGDLWDFAVWDRMLSPDELFRLGSGQVRPNAFPTALVEWVPLEYDPGESLRRPAAIVTGTVGSARMVPRAARYVRPSHGQLVAAPAGNSLLLRLQTEGLFVGAGGMAA